MLLQDWARENSLHTSPTNSCHEQLKQQHSPIFVEQACCILLLRLGSVPRQKLAQEALSCGVPHTPQVAEDFIGLLLRLCGWCERAITVFCGVSSVAQHLGDGKATRCCGTDSKRG
jgi:hypothetical protein